MSTQLNKIMLCLLAACLLSLPGCSPEKSSENSGKIIGWNILSDDIAKAEKTIVDAKDYGVNHLQLSHDIIHDLREIKNPGKQKLVNSLIDNAHKKGIPEVVVWDHALYDLNYYPSEFKSAKNGKINIDNPEFWEWLKNDYRQMLDLIPEADGVVLTFIETGARIEEQFSDKLQKPEEKLALLVDNISSVVIGERNLKLYVRDFSYTKDELSTVLKCLDLIHNKDVVVMCKEVPHDFFVTHPVAWWVQNIKQKVIIEFDCTHEFNGQSVVSSIFPEVHFNRWEYYKSLPNVIGFSIRTDRLGTTSILGRPSEINLFAIHRLSENPSIGLESVYDEFIVDKYGEKVLDPVKSIFKKAPEIITSVYYTLGLNTARHSSLNFDYRSIYTRHVSGRWMDNPTISINHGVNKEFHYWIDIVNHLSPAEYKAVSKINEKEIPEVLKNKWVQPVELMDEEYLQYVIREKDYGKRMAAEVLQSLSEIRKDFKTQSGYEDLYDTFERTELSGRLFSGMAKAYYGIRIYNRGNPFRTSALKKIISDGLKEMRDASEEIKNYNKSYPRGQYDWKKDADIATEYYNQYNEMFLIKSDG